MTSTRERLRYANCWEDAEVVGRALAPLDGARCLSIASGGDNSFSLLARGAAHVLAVDRSPAQIALVELKRAAFAVLDHPALLSFLGARPSRERRSVYAALRPRLDGTSRRHWDARLDSIDTGVIHAGRLEGYFRLFRRVVLPLVHGRRAVEAMLAPRPRAQRERFYRDRWDTRAWRMACRAFFSRPAMSRLGRDPEFFRHAHGDIAAQVLERARHAFTVQVPGANPYLRYILTGGFGDALPDYLRPDRHAVIRERLDRLELRLTPLETALDALAPASIDAFNLSDVAEYMDLASYHRLLERIRRVAAPGARLAYWNLLVPRHRPLSMEWLDTRDDEARRLHGDARAFFYERLVLEVVR